MGLSDEEYLRMEEISNKQAIAVIDPKEPANNGQHSMVATEQLPIAKYVTNEQIIAEEKFLAAKEADVEKRYTGLRGYFRIFHVSSVIGKLALYLYLDQYEIHHKAHVRYAKERMNRARRLTRAAVIGERLFGVRLWFLDMVLLFLRRIVIGGETNKEANQERQAVWLKDKLIELGPTFIKIGQSLSSSMNCAVGLRILIPRIASSYWVIAGWLGGCLRTRLMDGDTAKGKNCPSSRMCLPATEGTLRFTTTRKVNLL